MHTFFRIHKCQICEVYDISSLLIRVIHPYVYCVKDKLDFYTNINDILELNA